MKQDKWHGCYEGGWQGEIVPEAFAHPAKMAYGLLQRIYDHCFEQGWLKEGAVVVDPFGGIGSTGILGAYRGVQVACVELEGKFSGLAMQNMFLHLPKWRALGSPLPVIIQGDSRRLCELVGGADCVVGSPPFLQGDKVQARSGFGPGWRKIPFGERMDKCPMEGSYGHTPGQLGSMKAGSVEAVISSPPYSEGLTQGGGQRTEATNSGAGGDIAPRHYGPSPGNLGNLKPGSVDAVLSSPPYAETLTGDGTQAETAAESRAKRRTEGGSLGQSQRTQGYGSRGNLGNLKPGSIDAVVSSPPFMLSDNRNVDKTDFAHKFYGDQKYGDENPSMGGIGGDRLSDKAIVARQANVESIKNLGNIVSSGNEGQLINQDTFWAAAAEIVRQCHQILRPGGHAIWVVKDFVRKGQKVDFTGDWRRLCESAGFETVCVHHAMLVKESRHKTLFGHTQVEKTERKSFFRRLAESKGSPPIDYEVVLCMEKISQNSYETKHGTGHG